MSLLRDARYVLALTVGLLAATCPLNSVQSAPNDSASVMHRMTDARKSLRTLTATFVQRRHLELFSSDVRSQGKLTLVAPDKLRWDLLPPDDVTYWVTPAGVSFRTGKRRGHVDRASAGALAATLDDMMALLGGDLSRLRKRYRLEVKKLEGGRIQWTATPKASDEALRKLVRKIRVVLDADLVTPVRVTVWENKNDFTEIVFSNVKKNLPVAASAMVP